MIFMANKTVLLVDDEPMILEVLEDLLAHDYQTLSAQNGSEALACYTANSDRIDVMITDLQMPHLTGDKLIARIRSLNPHLPIIVLTGYAGSIDLAQLGTLPKVIVLQKPFDVKVLLDQIHSFIAG